MLQQVVREAAIGARLADKLLKVWRRNGQAQVVFIHLEVQGSYDTACAERMFVYHYRLFDRYRQPIVSLAVLGDDRQSWQPSRFQTALRGCEAELHFPIIKLTDYQKHWETLAASHNPFALMVMAHLKARATRKRPQERLHWKFYLVKRLYQIGYNREDILELFRFIDWLLVLPEILAQAFHEQLKAYEAKMSKRRLG